MIDAKQRAEALDISQSFIVQAPAGSGKTGVLTQRILKLLTVVERPEQILAITFTKKAAAEMRTRVAEALHSAATGTAPTNPHEKTYFDLATAALARDRAKQWHLLENLGRLRLQTIDSLCSSLVKENPLTSGLGAQFGIEDDASELYAEASRSLLAMLDEEGPIGEALFRVLAHFDNQFQKLQSLISQMLEKRDHWLRDVTQTQQNWETFKSLLSHSLQNINDEAEQKVIAALTPAHLAELDALTVYAANQLHLEKIDHSLLAVQPDTQNYRKQQFALFLKKDLSGWRAKLDKTMGFPAGEKGPEKKLATEFKSRAKELIDSFERGDEPYLQQVQAFITAPDPHLTGEQWRLLEDLVLVVRYAAAHLKLAFEQRNAVDFSEVQMAALLALGADDKPSDAMLSMDDRIAHILVDEFQDTSMMQVELLEQLTEGWQMGDGRTLFLVGDPMQSIYAFRKADVGLFLKLWHQQRVGQVVLTPLQLCMNFRSSPVVLNWVNETFYRAFPRQDDPRSGAVHYSHSEPGRTPVAGDLTQFHLFCGEDSANLAPAEAKWIAETIHSFAADTSVAILAKGKAHVYYIANALRQHNIAFQAVEIERLTENQIIVDLISLYQVCLSPGNKVAWFALMRGPWCGLSLQELEQVAAAHPHPWQALNRVCEEANLIEVNTRQRLVLLRNAIALFYQERLQRPFAEALQDLALTLGFAATARSDADVEAMEVFFALLKDVMEVGGYPDQATLQRKLQNLYVPPEPVTEGQLTVQIMTMHKSKGLEFDVVFLPQLQRRSRNDDKPLIFVDKQTAFHDKDQELFMAPVGKAGDSDNSVYQYLWHQHQQRSSNEAIRLLYVACTRARRRLYLSGCLKKADAIQKPVASSLLYPIWAVVESEAVHHDIETQSSQSINRTFRRPLSSLADMTATPVRVINTASALPMATPATDDTTDIYRSAGILMHKMLENWARHPDLIPALLPATLLEHWQRQLRAQGHREEECMQAVQWIQRALTNIINNAQRRYWLLEQPHQQSQVEFSVSATEGDTLQQWIIDRTFVENGVRHIVDYKLAEPSDDLTSFVESEVARYGPQLKKYREILTVQDNLPCRSYLYFPLIDHLQEVEI